MKLLFIHLFSFFVFNSPPWLTNLDTAMKTAQENHQMILLNFSGSDWCGPCIRLRKEIFDGERFQRFAGEKLVLLNADFPRQKKNQLPHAQQELNDRLADRYNSKGTFPLTLLLTVDGRILRSWEGFPKEGGEKFIEEINNALYAAR